MYSILILTLLLASGLSTSDAKCTETSVDGGRNEPSSMYVCLDGDLKDLDSVPRSAEWIEFTIGRFDVIPAGAFSKFYKLRRLTFFNCKLSELSPDAFRGLDSLEWLIFYKTKVGVARAEMFKHIPNLKVLKLDGAGIMYIEPEVFDILSKRLEVLSISNNDLDCLPIDSLAKIERLNVTNIEENPWQCGCKSSLNEYFSSRHIHQITNNDFIQHRRKRGHSYTSSYASENSYAVNTNYYTTQCMAEIKYPPLPPAVSVVKDDSYYIRYDIELREQIINSVHQLDTLPDNIGWIELYDLRIPRLYRYMFFRFGNTLRSISMRNCGIEDIEIEAFAGLHKLERLILIGARLPFIRSGVFRDLISLQDLTIQQANVESIEYGALDHLKNLRRLNLDMNRLTCLPEDKLQGLQKLDRFEANGNPWTCSCREGLMNYLLNRRIAYGINDVCFQEGHALRPLGYDGYYNYTTNGTIRWSWGYTIHKPTRPPPITYRPPVVLSTPTPIRRPACRAISTGQLFHSEYYNHLRSHTWLCEDATLDDVRLIPSIVETIIFSKSKIPVLRSDQFRQFDGFLKRLEFRDCGIQEINGRAFAGLRNLEILVIQGNDFKVVRSEWFTDLRHLEHLNLAKNNIDVIENGVFEILDHLVSVDISDNKLNCIGTEKLSSLRYLRDFHLAGNPWTCLCAEALHRFVNSRNLFCGNTCLDVVLRSRCHNIFNPVTTQRPALPTLPPLPPLPPLTTASPVPKPPDVIKGYCNSDHDGRHYHCSYGDRWIFEKIPSYVTSIELYNCYIPDLPANAFSRFDQLTELIVRNSSLVNIDDRAFDGLQKLEKLVIKGNKFAVAREGWFRHCENIQWLDLGYNQLVEIENGAFQHLKNLQYLNLEGNRFVCIYTNWFVQLPRLDTVEFSRNPLKWRCWQELKQFLEIRGIGYTDHKCPYDASTFIRNLQKDTTAQAQTARGKAAASAVTYYGFILTAAILYSLH